jgi:hypothetical protein
VDIEITSKAKRIIKTVMASRMKTERRQLDRLLDPENKSVTLSTLRRAATVLGRSHLFLTQEHEATHSCPNEFSLRL